MGSKKLIGIVLVVAGLIMLYFGWQSSQSLGDQVVETFTGRFTEGTMWFLIVGAVATVAGLFLTVMKK